jgi:hypothetical protein
MYLVEFIPAEWVERAADVELLLRSLLPIQA